MPKFIIDSPRKSGKSTLIFGYSHRDSDKYNTPSLKSKGYTCFPESTEAAHYILKQAGINGKEDRQSLVDVALEVAKEYLLMANEINKIYFFDRSIYSFENKDNVLRLVLPEWYNVMKSEKHYSSPIFICAPLESIDGEGRGSLEIRMENMESKKIFYQSIGYDVKVLPYFGADKVKNNEKRIEIIEPHISNG